MTAAGERDVKCHHDVVGVYPLHDPVDPAAIPYSTTEAPTRCGW